MAVIRLTLLVAALGGLTLLLVQNWTPVLPLVFLGMASQPLPLALWILFSTAAGAGTSLLINILFKLSNYFGRQSQPAPAKSTTRRTKVAPKEEYAPRSSSSAPPQANSEEFDDWEPNSAGDDWDFEQKPQPAPAPQPQADASTYERPQKPKSGSQTGSTYSYSYREPKNTAAGKTESVYDADYRVIIPPYQPPSDEVTNDGNDDENDWGIFEDDDVEDEKPPRK